MMQAVFVLVHGALHSSNTIHSFTSHPRVKLHLCIWFNSHQRTGILVYCIPQLTH